MIKNLPAIKETWVQSLGREDPLEEGTATHSSILARRIPWTEESGGLQFMGSQRIRHDWATNMMIQKGKCLGVSNLRKAELVLSPGPFWSFGPQNWLCVSPLSCLVGSSETSFWGKPKVRLSLAWILCSNHNTVITPSFFFSSNFSLTYF